MNAYLSKLGVPSLIQQFFNVEEPFFDFGDQVEHFGDGFHLVPSTRNMWLAGNQLGNQVILTFSALEAIAFLTLNQVNYPDFKGLVFIATGTRISTGQLKWIRSNFKGRQFTLAFGADLIGHLTDIKVAAGLKDKTVSLSLTRELIAIRYREHVLAFDPDLIRLHTFEAAFGVRSKIRTLKPLNQLTFLDELKHDTTRRHHT